MDDAGHGRHAPGVDLLQLFDEVEAIRTGADNVRLELELRAPADHVVCWRYADPDGPEHNSAHTSLADLRAELRRADGRSLALNGAMTASYELGMRETDHGLAVQPYDDGRL